MPHFSNSLYFFFLFLVKTHRFFSTKPHTHTHTFQPRRTLHQECLILSGAREAAVKPMSKHKHTPHVHHGVRVRCFVARCLRARAKGTIISIIRPATSTGSARDRVHGAAHFKTATVFIPRAARARVRIGVDDIASYWHSRYLSSADTDAPNRWRNEMWHQTKPGRMWCSSEARWRWW